MAGRANGWSTTAHGGRNALIFAAVVIGAVLTRQAACDGPRRDDAYITWRASAPQLAVAFDPTGRRVAAGGWDGSVTVWDAETGQREHTLLGHTDRVYAVAFAPDGKRLASGSKDSTARIWDVRSGTLLNVARGHRDRVMALAYSSDRSVLVTGSRDTTVKVWSDTYDCIETLRPSGGFVSALAASPRDSTNGFGDWF